VPTSSASSAVAIIIARAAITVISAVATVERTRVIWAVI
jgi:hypothetical protein